MSSPGSYYNPSIEYVEKTECLRGKPLISEPLEFAIIDEYEGVRRERAAVVKFIAPKKGRGKANKTESVRVWINGATFSLAIITPKGSKESYLDAMFEDADPGTFQIEFGSDTALDFLRIDMAARCGNEEAINMAAAAEFGIFLRRISSISTGSYPAKP